MNKSRMVRSEAPNCRSCLEDYVPSTTRHWRTDRPDVFSCLVGEGAPRAGFLHLVSLEDSARFAAFRITAAALAPLDGHAHFLGFVLVESVI